MRKLALHGALLLSLGCLPQDTRPEPAAIRTELALGPEASANLEGEGLQFTTTDGYQVTVERIIMSFGRVKFTGDECNQYAEGQGMYSRVVDPLQPGEQPISLHYALGQCNIQFRLYPPEDWAHVDNPGVSEADRAELRAAEVDPVEAAAGREQFDDFSGPRGPKGATLSVTGTALGSGEGEEAIPFELVFGVTSYVPHCAPPGQEEFEFRGGEELTLVAEMLPEQLFGTCGDSGELRFAALARAFAQQGAGTALTLDTLSSASLVELSDEAEAAFYRCERPMAGDALPPLPDGEVSREPTAQPVTLRDWLNMRVRYDLFAMRDAECRYQGAVVYEQF